MNSEALAEQEAGSDHFDSDGFVKMRCEFWYQYQHSEEHPDYEIRYRSYGIMSSPTPKAYGSFWTWDIPKTVTPEENRLGT